jgi:hypothetical protein
MANIARQCFDIFIREMKTLVRHVFVHLTMFTSNNYEYFSLFKSRSTERNKCLEDQCQFLLIKRTHIRSAVRDEAKLYLQLLLSEKGSAYSLPYNRLYITNKHLTCCPCRNRFPYLLCSPVIVETVMNIINILSYSLDDENMYKVTLHHRVPQTDHKIQFSDTHEKRLVRFLLISIDARIYQC